MALPAAPTYPPAPITGPGESQGTLIASRLVNPTNETIQPNPRSQGWSVRRWASNQNASAPIDRTRKYAPKPKSSNRIVAARAPAGPHTLFVSVRGG